MLRTSRAIAATAALLVLAGCDKKKTDEASEPGTTDDLVSISGIEVEYDEAKKEYVALVSTSPGAEVRMVSKTIKAPEEFSYPPLGKHPIFGENKIDPPRTAKADKEGKARISIGPSKLPGDGSSFMIEAGIDYRPAFAGVETDFMPQGRSATPTQLQKRGKLKQKPEAYTCYPYSEQATGSKSFEAGRIGDKVYFEVEGLLLESITVQGKSTKPTASKPSKDNTPPSALVHTSFDPKEIERTGTVRSPGSSIRIPFEYTMNFGHDIPPLTWRGGCEPKNAGGAQEDPYKQLLEVKNGGVKLEGDTGDTKQKSLIGFKDGGYFGAFGETNEEFGNLDYVGLVETDFEKLETCKYTGDHEVERSKQTAKVTIYDRRSGKVIEKKSLVAKTPPKCPKEIPSTQSYVTSFLAPDFASAIFEKTVGQ